MYKDFFNFSEKPFNMTPDPDYFYASTKHRHALDSLLYAVVERKGFVVITGEVGAGKTTVCRTLINQLKDDTVMAMITNTYLTPKQLLVSILDEYEIPHKNGAKTSLLNALNQFLIERLAEDKNVVLIIDEAQNLSPKCLEEVRLLSNLETEKDKLIQIILMGQPELRDIMRLQSMRQFKQRVSLHYHLRPLDEAEVVSYIKHRVACATSEGFDNKHLFTEKALKAVYAFSEGVPRIVNNVCDNALLTAYAGGLRVVNKGVIDEVTGELFESGEDDVIASLESEIEELEPLVKKSKDGKR